jgi:hypothetical protein
MSLSIVFAQAAGAARARLACLPDGCRPDEPFALARLITSQDEGNAVLVARPRDGGPLVGCRGGRHLNPKLAGGHSEPAGSRCRQTQGARRGTCSWQSTAGSGQVTAAQTRVQ